MYPTGMLVLLCLSAAIHVPAITHEAARAVQAVVPVAAFGAFELRNGGVAIVRSGPVARVTLVQGSLTYTSVQVDDRGMLVIDKCPGRCPRGYELEVEIVTPDLGRISVAEGATIQAAGDFHPRISIDVAVSQGGTIDIRSMPVNRVTAYIYQGGQIFTIPQTAMLASVVHGGRVVYWGDAEAKSSIEDGGIVARGTAADLHKPLSQLIR